MRNMLDKLLTVDLLVRDKLTLAGQYIPLLLVRCLLAWEYWEAGLQKFSGENWFHHIQDNFPFPFNIIDTQISWFMATWFELLGGLALLVGLGVRYVSMSLLVLTLVATLAVHIPPEGWSSFSDMLAGYAITDKGFGNYKLPLLYTILFMPLLFLGPGKISLDHLIYKHFKK